MPFTHAQATAFSNTPITGNNNVVQAVLGTNPALGDIVVLGIIGYKAGIEATIVSVLDGNANAYTVSTSSPAYNSGVAAPIWIYYLIAPSNADKTITVIFTQLSMDAVALWVDDFTPSAPVSFDTDARLNTGTGSGTSLNGLSITPAGAGELLYAIAAVQSGGASAASPWTENGHGTDPFTGTDVEYILSSASGATAINFTDTVSGDTYEAVVAAFKISGGASFQPDEDYWQNMQQSQPELNVSVW